MPMPAMGFSPVGAIDMPWDLADVPALARELKTLTRDLRLPAEPELALAANARIGASASSRWGGLKREPRLHLGWLCLQAADADEVKALAASALLPWGKLAERDWATAIEAGRIEAVYASDRAAAEVVGSELLARAYTIQAAILAWLHWAWPPLASPLLRNEDLAGHALWRLLVGELAKAGRAGLDAALQWAVAAEDAEVLAWRDRVDRLRQPWALSGGSHRCAAQAWCWEGLIERSALALEPSFLSHAGPSWRLWREQLAAEAEAARHWDRQRRSTTLSTEQWCRFARAVEWAYGGDKALPVWRRAFELARNPEALLGWARCARQTEPERALSALQQVLARGAAPLAAEARFWLARA